MSKKLSRSYSREDLRITVAALLEAGMEPTFEQARKTYRFYKREFYTYLTVLAKKGIVLNLPDYEQCVRDNPVIDTIPSTPQLRLFAYSDLSWEKAQTLTEEECKEVARRWLERNGR